MSPLCNHSVPRGSRANNYKMSSLSDRVVTAQRSNTATHSHHTAVHAHTEREAHAAAQHSNTQTERYTQTHTLISRDTLVKTLTISPACIDLLKD